jgi:hypothetical protein
MTKLLGADGETRTRTALRHYPLKIACLPIPPRRHKTTFIDDILAFSERCGKKIA